MTRKLNAPTGKGGQPPSRFRRSCAAYLQQRLHDMLGRPASLMRNAPQVPARSHALRRSSDLLAPRAEEKIACMHLVVCSADRGHGEKILVPR